MKGRNLNLINIDYDFPSIGRKLRSSALGNLLSRNQLSRKSFTNVAKARNIRMLQLPNVFFFNILCGYKIFLVNKVGGKNPVPITEFKMWLLDPGNWCGFAQKTVE